MSVRARALRLIAPVLSCAFLSSSLALASAPQGGLVLEYGQPIPGASEPDPLNALRTPAVGNDGTWATLAGNLPGFGQDAVTNLLVKNGVVLLEEGVSRLNGRIVRGIETPRVLDDGRVLTLALIGSLSSSDEVIALDDEVLLGEGDVVLDRTGAAIGTLGGIRSGDLFITDDGRVIVRAFVTDASGASEVRVVARDITTAGSQPFSLLGPGDVLLDGSMVNSVQHVDVSRNGRLASYGREVTTDGVARTVYRVDGVLALEDRDAAPLPGATYAIPTSVFGGSGLAVSNDGKLGLLGNAETSSTSEVIVASGDELIAVIGQSPVGSAGPAINDVAAGSLDMTESGQLVWVARDENLDYGVYLDGERLIFPGQPAAGSTLVDAGVPAFSFFASPLSTRAGFLIEVVELADGRRGLWLLQRSIGVSLACG
ncbi:MAG: hypothetical protein AAGG01_08745, partial [Planctomycetota bacterium]